MQNFSKGGETTGRSTTAVLDNKPSNSVGPQRKPVEIEQPSAMNQQINDALDDPPASPPDSASSSEDRVTIFPF